MGIFSFGRKSSNKPKNPYRSSYFQDRIRTARGYSRVPKIAPKARSDLRSRAWTGRALLVLFLLLALFGAVIYFFAISDYFLVDSVSLTAETRVDAQQIERLVLDLREEKYLLFIPRNHMLLVNKANLSEMFRQYSPYISEVSMVKKLWPSELMLTLAEREPAAILRTGERYFFIDNQAVVYEEVLGSFATSTESYFIVNDLSGSPAEIGDDLEIEKLLAFLTTVSDHLQSRLSLKISNADLVGLSIQDIAVSISENFVVYFNRDYDADKQLRTLDLILNQEIPADRRRDLAYVDLRLPTAAYYCFLQEPCAQVPVDAESESPLDQTAPTE